MEPARTSIAWITNKPLRSQGYRYLRIAIVLYSTVIHIDQSFGTHHFIVAPPPYRFQLSAHFVPSGPHTDAGCEIIYWIHYSFIHALCSFILLPCHPDASVDRPPRPVNLIDPIFYIQGIRGLHLAGCKWHFFTLKFKRVRGENVEKHVHSLYGGSEVREFCVRSGIRGLRNTSKQGCLNLPPEKDRWQECKAGVTEAVGRFCVEFWWCRPVSSTWACTHTLLTFIWHSEVNWERVCNLPSTMFILSGLSGNAGAKSTWQE